MALVTDDQTSLQGRETHLHVVMVSSMKKTYQHKNFLCHVIDERDRLF